MRQRNTRRQTTTLILFPDTEVATEGKCVATSRFENQQYVPTGAIQSPLTSQPWGMKDFFLCDPFRTLLLFGENIPEEESETARGE
jgi:hypothetical protein